MGTEMKIKTKNSPMCNGKVESEESNETCEPDEEKLSENVSALKLDDEGEARLGSGIRAGKKSETEEKATKGEKTNQKWFCISDTCVSEVTLEKVLRCQAYMLFYERIE